MPENMPKNTLVDKQNSMSLTKILKNNPFANERGMTLIEIMIVVAIIAGLMAVLGSNVVSSYKKSQVSQTRIAMNEISKQLESYNMACNSYPTTEQGLAALVKSPGTDACPNWGPEPYFKNESQLKDRWARPFLYESDGSTFVIRSLGADRKEGGESFNKDISTEDAQ